MSGYAEGSERFSSSNGELDEQSTESCASLGLTIRWLRWLLVIAAGCGITALATFITCSELHGSTGWDWSGSPDLNYSNRPVRTRMPGGVAGARPDGRPLCRFEKRVWTGHMVDRCTGTWLTLFGKQTCREFDHALERERHHEPERRVRSPSQSSRRHYQRAVPAFRHQPPDRLQVAKSLPEGGCGRPSGAIQKTS